MPRISGDLTLVVVAAYEEGVTADELTAELDEVVAYRDISSCAALNILHSLTAVEAGEEYADANGLVEVLGNCQLGRYGQV